MCLTLYRKVKGIFKVDRNEDVNRYISQNQELSNLCEKLTKQNSHYTDKITDLKFLIKERDEVNSRLRKENNELKIKMNG